MKNKKVETIQYRIERAIKTFNDAKLLVENKRWNSAVNRLYYCCFYLVNALLLKTDFKANTHNGVRTIFFKEFIHNGKLESKWGKLYSDLFDWRSKGDYFDFFDFSGDDVVPLIQLVEEFINAVKKILAEK